MANQSILAAFERMWLHIVNALGDIRTQLSNMNNKLNINILDTTRNVYVSTNGSDTTGDGTSSKPWKTISKAISYAPISTLGSNIDYIINISEGTYTENISITNRQLKLSSLGQVVIKPSNTSKNTIEISKNAIVTVCSGTSSFATTAPQYFYVYGGSGTASIDISYGSYLIFENLKDIHFYGITNEGRCIRCNHNSYVVTNEVENIRIMDACKMANVVKVENNSYVNLDATWTINSSSSCSSYAFASLTNSYLYLSNMTISSLYPKGLYAIKQGKVNIVNVTNNSPIPQTVKTGGIIN